uniref:Uncharacterized protein n=1 Tax=Hippocampus comes TaxID=109280 RepID=A0A3Q2XPJ6_HIPCM
MRRRTRRGPPRNRGERPSPTSSTASGPRGSNRPLSRLCRASTTTTAAASARWPATCKCSIADPPHVKLNKIGRMRGFTTRAFLLGNATWRWHFPARLEPLEDRGARRAAAEEERRRRDGDDRMAERPGRRQQAAAAASAEAQIGQKLREIGDKFQRDHLDVVSNPTARRVQFQRNHSAALFFFFSTMTFSNVVAFFLLNIQKHFL